MSIEKLEEFARDGQKNTDELILTDGFPRPKFPARQWFNYLFNMLSLKINEIIDLDPVARSEIIDNLTTNDSNKPVSAKQAKVLQDNKLEAADLKDASMEQKGVVQLNNTLTSTSTSQALTAAQGKVLSDQAFGVGQTYQDVKSQRVNGTTYTNTTGKLIFVILQGRSSSTSSSSAEVQAPTSNDWMLVGSMGISTDTECCSFFVPSGWKYRTSNFTTIEVWLELR